jgi:hypothetical protein
MSLTYKDVKQQSQAVFNQFGRSIWIPNAQKNAQLSYKDCNELQDIGIGKTILVIAFGPSLENHIELIKANRHKFDIICCDKAFKVLMERGIKPDYVNLSDAQISLSWIGDTIEKTRDVKLLASPYANPEWTTKWRGDIYFYVNKDAIESERIFAKIFDHKLRQIPAGSNVSNSSLIFLTGCDNEGYKNFCGYEKYLLTGYDYSWKPNGNYYAFSNPRPKRYYMHHNTIIDYSGNPVFTSGNLIFSAKWLHQYVTTFDLPVINCSEGGLLDIPRKSSLSSELSKLPDDNSVLANYRQAYHQMQQSFTDYKTKNENLNKLRRQLWQ